MGKKCWIPSPSTVLVLLLCILSTQTTIHTYIRPALILRAKTRTMPRYKKLYTLRGFLCTCVPPVPGDSMSAPVARKAVTTLYEFVWMRASWGTLVNFIFRIFCFQDILDAQLFVRQAHRSLIFLTIVNTTFCLLLFAKSQNCRKSDDSCASYIAAAWISQVVFANFRLVLNSSRLFNLRRLLYLSEINIFYCYWYSHSSKLNILPFNLLRLQNPSNTDLSPPSCHSLPPPPHPTLPRHNLISFLPHAFQPLPQAML